MDILVHILVWRLSNNEKDTSPLHHLFLRYLSGRPGDPPIMIYTHLRGSIFAENPYLWNDEYCFNRYERGSIENIICG